MFWLFLSRVAVQGASKQVWEAFFGERPVGWDARLARLGRGSGGDAALPRQKINKLSFVFLTIKIVSRELYLERPAGEDRRPLVGICRVRIVYEKDSSCMEHGSSLGLFGLFGNS